MHLAFVYFNESNKNFKKHFIRYNKLLKNYFDNDDSSLIKQLNDTYNSLINTCDSYEILNQKETEIYNVIMDFLANDLNVNKLNVESLITDEAFKNNLISKLNSELNVDKKTLENMTNKVMNFINTSPDQNIEILFIPSVVKV